MALIRNVPEGLMTLGRPGDDFTRPDREVPSPPGHVSIAFELGANPLDHLQAILRVMARHGQPGS